MQDRNIARAVARGGGPDFAQRLLEHSASIGVCGRGGGSRDSLQESRSFGIPGMAEALSVPG
eukprot:1091640-Alexandrium_andersonii.AAC.1